MSRSPLESTVRRLNLLSARAQAEHRLPSLSDAVFRDGRLVWSRQLGALAYDAAGAPTGLPSLRTSYRIGSITKSFTAVLLMQLRDEGVLDLDDAVGDHLPAAAGPVREAFARVRLGDVAAHRGGLAREPEAHGEAAEAGESWAAGGWWERNAGPGTVDFLAQRSAGDVRLPAPAGHHYSNLGYGLLGAVVEAHRGTPWRLALADRVITRLGMYDTGCEPGVERATGYSMHPWCDELHREPTPDTGAMAPAGQLWSTVEDLGRWGSFLADPAEMDPNASVLRASSVAELRTGRGPSVEGEPSEDDVLGGLETEYGLGLSTSTVGGRLLVGHGGSMPGYLAGLMLHPPSRAVAVSFASAYLGYRPTRHAAELLTTVLDAEPTEPRPWRPVPPTAGVRELLGSWWWGDVHLLLTCQGSDGSVLTVGGRRVGRSTFLAVAADTWRGVTGEHSGEVLHVRRDSVGVPVELALSTYCLGRRPYEVPPG